MTSNFPNMDTPPSSSSSTVRFFKIITKTILEAGKLRLPEGFSSKYGAHMSNPLSLKTLDGKEWIIYWTKIDEGIWFQKGWKDFALHYSLGHGHIVFFEYDKKTSQFRVHIFDKSTLEIEYLVHESQEDQNNLDIKEPVESSHKKTRKKSQISSPQPHKKLRTDKSEDDGGGSSNLQKLPKAVKVKEEQEQELEQLAAEAFKRASNFKSENPSFIFVVKHCYLYCNFLHVPLHFVNKYLKKAQGDTLLELLDGRTWPSKYRKGRISLGWMKFVSDNKLKVGDVCVFVLTNSQDLTFKVPIFRLGEKPHSPPPQVSVQEELSPMDPATIPEVESEAITSNKEEMGVTTEFLKVKKEQEEFTSRIAEALFKARNFRSNYPSFTVIMLSNNIDKDLYVPSKFAKKYLKEKQRDIILQVLDERTWLVKYDLGRIGAGWKTFASDISLKVGDVCRFELTKRQVFTLKVIIFRLGEELQSPPPQESVHGDGENELYPANLPEVENKKIISTEGSKETPRNSLGTSPFSITNEALTEAEEFTSENPFFTMMINLHPRYRPSVPKRFATKYLEKKKQILKFKVCGKIWPVRLLCYPYKPSFSLSRGWPLFLQESKLKNGDVCVFELINREDLLLDVHIFRSKSIMTNEVVLPCHTTGRKKTPGTTLQTWHESDSTYDALEEAKNFTSENPFFMVIIRPNRSRKYKPRVPHAFIRNFLHSKTQVVRLQFDKKLWTVNCLFYPCKARTGRGLFSSGWDQFSEGNKLQAGDVCLFELTNKEDVVFDAHIFRGHM